MQNNQRRAKTSNQTAMVWNLTCTILVTVLGSFVFFSATYGIHAYIIPVIRRKRQIDYTLPQAERRSNPQLRDSLYSMPSLNYVDPRNSIADTDLRSSRWSTYIHDLDPPTTVSKVIPKSKEPCVAEKTWMSKERNRKARERSQSRPTMLSNKSRTHKRQTKSQTFNTQTPRQAMRRRSKSDSLISNPRGLLVSSHSFFTDCNDTSFDSPTDSHFSGTTVLPSPQYEIKKQ